MQLCDVMYLKRDFPVRLVGSPRAEVEIDKDLEVRLRTLIAKWDGLRRMRNDVDFSAGVGTGE